MNKRLWLSVCAGFGLGAGTAGADIWFVATNGSDSAAGTNWATAYATIGNALATNALVPGENHEIWVSNGTYNLGAQLVLTKGVRLWGASGADKTILDGGGANRCVFITNGVLDGFTVTNGYADNAAGNQYGGGVYIVTGQVLNCTVAGNRAYTVGGGIYGKPGGLGVVSNCVIAGNTATNSGNSSYGGGAYFEGAGWQVLDCPSINDNLASARAGGVYLTSGGVISNCVVSNNVCYQSSGSSYGGGLYVDARAQVVDCLVCSNIAERSYYGYGGGIYVDKTGLVANCTVRDNASGGYGGGIAAYNGALIRKCPEIAGNRTYLGSTEYGGGIFVHTGCRVSDCTIRNNRGRFGAGMAAHSGTNIIVSNCVITDNISLNETGGIHSQLTGMILRNCLITRNICQYGAGGIQLNGSALSIRVENCTVVSNWCYAGTGGLNCPGTNTVINTICYSNINRFGVSDISAALPATTFTNCCTPTAASLPGANNIPDDPNAADPVNGDWRLTADSPCVNAGTNEPWVEGAVDLDGRTRVDGFSRRVDIGAYEFLPAGALFQMR